MGKISEEPLKSWVDICIKNNIPLANVAKFLMGNVANKIGSNVKQFQKANSEQGRDVVLAAEKKLNPDMDRSDIYSRIDSIRQEVEKGMADFEQMKLP